MGQKLNSLLYHADFKNDLDCRISLYEEGIDGEELKRRLHQNYSYFLRGMPKHLLRGALCGTIAIFGAMGLANLLGADTTQVQPEFFILGMGMMDLSQYGIRYSFQNLKELHRYD